MKPCYAPWKTSEEFDAAMERADADVEAGRLVNMDEFLETGN